MLVTGSAQGIGYAVAEQATAAGAACALIDRNLDGVRAAAKRLKGSTAWSCDVSDRNEVISTVQGIEDACGPIDVLVNSAGVWGHTPVLEVAEEDWDRIQQVNVKGVLFCVQAVAPAMQLRGTGNIVNIASMAGFGGSANWSAYCASKAAVISLTLALANELRQNNVQVNAVCPGAVDTPMTDDILRQEPGSSFGHAVSPAAVAEIVLQLVSPSGGSHGAPIVAMGEPGQILGMTIK